MKKVRILANTVILILVLTVFAYHIKNPSEIQASEITMTITPPPSENPQPAISPVPVRELKIKGSKIYYYYKGKMAKSSWKRYEGYKYYFSSKGYACTGGARIDNKTYVFDQNGHLLEKQKNHMRTILGKKYYIISDSGRAATGYFIYKNRLYYADSTGRCYQNRSRENGQLKFTSSGAAVNDVNAQVKMWAMRTVASVTKPNMKQRQKLYACWKYLVNANNYSYGGPDPNQKKADWQRTTVLRMIRTNVGNCFGFSCTFSALARELGYKPYLIMGRVPGTRDGAADGLTSHCWVRINGLYYDPEADWAGWMQGVFAYSYYPTSRCQILKITPYYQ